MTATRYCLDCGRPHPSWAQSPDMCPYCLKCMGCMAPEGAMHDTTCKVLAVAMQSLRSKSLSELAKEVLDVTERRFHVAVPDPQIGRSDKVDDIPDLYLSRVFLGDHVDDGGGLSGTWSVGAPPEADAPEGTIQVCTPETEPPGTHGTHALLYEGEPRNRVIVLADRAQRLVLAALSVGVETLAEPGEFGALMVWLDWGELPCAVVFPDGHWDNLNGWQPEGRVIRNLLDEIAACWAELPDWLRSKAYNLQEDDDDDE